MLIIKRKIHFLNFSQKHKIDNIGVITNFPNDVSKCKIRCQWVWEFMI